MSTRPDNRLSLGWSIFTVLIGVVVVSFFLIKAYIEKGYIDGLDIIASLAGFVVLVVVVVVARRQQKRDAQIRDVSTLSWAETTRTNDLLFLFYPIPLVLLAVMYSYDFKGAGFGDVQWLKLSLVGCVMMFFGWLEYHYWTRGRRKLLEDARAKHGLCIGCGYDLRRMSAVNCPECGMSVYSAALPVDETKSQERLKVLSDLFVPVPEGLRYFRFNFKAIGLWECLKGFRFNPIFVILFLLSRGGQTFGRAIYIYEARYERDTVIDPERIPEHVMKRLGLLAEGLADAGFIDPVYLFPPGQTPESAVATVLYRHARTQYFIGITTPLGNRPVLESVEIVSRWADDRFLIASDIRRLNAPPPGFELLEHPKVKWPLLLKKHQQKLSRYPSEPVMIDSTDVLFDTLDRRAKRQTAYMLERGLYVEVSREEYLENTKLHAAPVNPE